MRNERRFWLALVITVVAVVVFVVWVGLDLGGQTVGHAVDDGMTATGAVVAAACCFWAARHHHGHVRRFWVLLSAAMVAWSVGEIVWGFYEVVLGQKVPGLSLADVGYLVAVPLAAAALALYPSTSVGGASRLRALLDGLIVAGSVFFVSWYLLLASVMHSSTSSITQTCVNLAYPLGDVVVLSLVVVALARTQSSARQSLLWVLGGLAAMAIADSGYVYLTAVRGYVSGDLIDTGWLVAYLAIALGALHSALGTSTSTIAERPEQHGDLRRSMVIYVPAAAAMGVAVVVVLQGHRIDAVLWMAGILTVAFVMARQVLALAENATLTDTLETRVIARTDELHHQALHDALTGLPNRSLIMDRIEQLLARSRRNGTSGAALHLDLDGFKIVNDTFGHALGDQLLEAVAVRLGTALRDADTIGRMGGDEFVIVVDGGPLEASPELVAHRLLEALHEPFEINGTPLAITASIGVATGDYESAGDLLRDADVALYEAKASGKNRYACYQPEMQAAIQDRLELELDLRFAAEHNEFRLVYQPIYDLNTMELLGVESLIRWHHPSRGVIAPSDFIPLLEDTGGIIDVGRWALDEACRQTQVWHHHGHILGVSVNVSGRQLDNDSIVDDVQHALDNSGLSAASLTIEVTETSLMRDADATARRLHELKSLGVQIAIDDFGTGYSSLAYLQRFPVDSVKIDRAFIISIDRGAESRALLHTLIQVGKDLGLKTLAEGVETVDQAEYLRQEHCDRVQGFYYVRPLDPHTLEATLFPAPTPPPVLEPTDGGYGS